MQLSLENKTLIKDKFNALKSKEEFLELLNFSKFLLYGEKAIPFKLKQITYYANPAKSIKRYNEFTIKKKSGDERKIHAPCRGLKQIQKCLNLILQVIYTPHPKAMGFIPNKSIVDNAKEHVGFNYVYNIDLKDFFPSIDQARIWKRLQLSPFNLGNIDSITDKKDLIVLRALKVSDRLFIAEMIAALCCHQMEVERCDENKNWQKVIKNVLPQGAATSPTLSNIICERLDRRLFGVAKRFGLRYSRYADDITFSSLHNVYQQGSDFLEELQRIIAEQGFHIKESKTRLQKDGYRKEVTGLLVNEKPNVQQRYIKQLRMWLYYWERYGYEKASEFFLQQYLADKGHVIKGKPDMANVIGGKLDYLKMVRGGENELYVKLKGRFDALTGKKESSNETLIESIAEKDFDKPLMNLLENLNNEQSTGGKKSKAQILAINTIEKSTIPILHNPKELVILLSKFSENSHPLKYACHSWEDGRVDDLFQDYSDFIKKFDEVGRAVCFKIQKLKKSLGTKILHFLNTNNEEGKYYIKDQPKKYYWGEYRMIYGWKSKELSNWAKKNSALDPFEFPLPQKSVISKRNGDIEISKFGDVIRVFKDEIEIRPEESALYNLIAELRRKHLGLDFKVNINDNLKGKQFYTDVHDFKRALNKIFREISVRAIHPIVSVSSYNFPQDEYTTIEILHHESYCIDKSSEEMTKEIVDGDFADIIKYLENLCDWSIESKFNDGTLRINYLSSSESDLAKMAIDKAEGFKHIFKFYKT